MSGFLVLLLLTCDAPRLSFSEVLIHALDNQPGESSDYASGQADFVVSDAAGSGENIFASGDAVSDAPGSGENIFASGDTGSGDLESGDDAPTLRSGLSCGMRLPIISSTIGGQRGAHWSMF